MKNIVAGHVAVTATEFVELALGIDLELFTGPPVESPLERAARLDVAAAVLVELESSDPEAAAYARSLMRAWPLTPLTGVRPSRRTVRRPVVSGVAA